ALTPISRDAMVGPYFQHQLVRIYLLAGEPERALDRLEPLLKVPYYLSPAWLRIDPTFAPLRGNPPFERLPPRPRRTEPTQRLVRQHAGLTELNSCSIHVFNRWFAQVR